MAMIQLQENDPIRVRREREMLSLLFVVDLRLEVHHKLKLISTMSIATFTDAIITLRSPFSYIVAALTCVAFSNGLSSIYLHVWINKPSCCALKHGGLHLTAALDWPVICRRLSFQRHGRMDFKLTDVTSKRSGSIASCLANLYCKSWKRFPGLPPHSGPAFSIAVCHCWTL